MDEQRSGKNFASPRLSGPTPIDRLPMVPPSMWTRGVIITGILLLSAGVWYRDFIWMVLQAPHTSWRILAMVVVPPLAWLAYVLWRWWDTPAEPREIVFGPDRVTLPVSPRSKASVELAYGDIKGVLMATRGDTTTVIVDTGSRGLSYPQTAFERAESPQRVRDEILRRIRQLPRATEIIEEMRRRQKPARIATSKPATLTKVLLGILGAYFAIELWMGVASEPFGLLKLGANSSALVAQGQLFRLVSANFLHQGWIHIIMNGIALLFLGSFVEKLVGSWRMLLVYLAGAVGGSLASYMAGPSVVSVGSSTAIFGLFGGFLVLHLRYWGQLPLPFRQSLKWWVVIIGLNAGLPVVLPVIDYMAHVGGLVAGGVCMALLVWPMEDLKPDRKASTVVRAITGVVSAVFVAGLVQAGIYGVQTHPQDDRAVYAGMLDEALASDKPAKQVNAIAWMAATNLSASQGQLEEARRAVKKVVGPSDGRVEIRDTLATVDYRLARISSGSVRVRLVDEAIDVERKVLQEARGGPELLGGGPRTYASQLARFLDYRREVVGPRLSGRLFDRAPTVRFEAGDSPKMVVEAPAEARRNAAIWAVVRFGDDLQGLVELCVPRGTESLTVDVRGAAADWPDGANVAAAMVEPTDRCRRPWQAWPMVQSVREMP